MNDQNVFVRLSSNIGQFKAQMVAASQAIKQVGDSTVAQAARADAGQKKIAAGMVAVGVAAAAMAAASIAAAVQLETRMQNVATIWTDSSVSIAQAGDRVVEMSTRLPQSANNLAEGLYDVASSGFQGADALRVLEAAGTAASAGLTDTATAARGITAVLNAYGLAADNASTVSDVLFQTVNLGVVTFEQLSNTMGDFVGTAAIAGVSIKDANAAFATMTLNGISAAESGTSLNRVMQEFVQPGEVMAALLKRLGYESGLAMVEELGLHGAVLKLNEAVGGNATAIAQIMPEMRSLRGFLALTSAEGENYTRVTAAMNDETALIGSTQAALAKQAESTSYQLTILKNNVVAIAQGFGEALLPTVKAVVGAFQTAVDIFGELPGWLQPIIIGAGILAGVLVGLVGSFILLAPAIAATGPAWAAFTGGIGAATGAVRGFMVALGPIGWIMAGIGAAVGIASMIWAGHAKGQADAKKRVDDLAKSLDKETQAITDQTKQVLRNMVAKDDLDKKAKLLKVSLDDLMLALLGDEDAARRVTAATTKSTEALYDEYVAATKAGVGIFEAKEAWDKATEAGEALTAAIDSTNEEMKEAVKQGKREEEAAKSASKAVDQLTRATTAKAKADDLAAAAAKAHADVLADMATTLNEGFSVSAALTAAADAYGGSQDTMTSAASDALEDRQRLESEALDKRHQLVAAALEKESDLRRAALEDRHDDELEVLAAIHQATMDALALRHRAEVDALEDTADARREAFADMADARRAVLDDQQREEKRALDDSQRAEKNALADSIRLQRRGLDARLAIIDEAFAKRKTAEDRAYEEERQRIQYLIDDTFGVERQGWQARLVELEDANAERERALKNEHDVAVQLVEDTQSDSERAQTQGLDDRQEAQDDAMADRLEAQDKALDDELEAQKKALDDELEQLKRGLADQHAAQKKGEDDRHDAVLKGAKDRHDAEKTALADDLAQLKTALADQQAAVATALENRQRSEDRAAETRRSNSAGQHQLTLEQLGTQLDELWQVQEDKLVNLETIWVRAGRDLPPAMMEELKALDPLMIDQLANSSDAGFNSFMDKLERNVTGVDPARLAAMFAPFNDEIRGLLAQVGEYGGATMMESVAVGLANNPAGAQRLRDVLAGLMAPRMTATPGVYGIPAPGGGFQLVRLEANGGILRFADGGEHHVAQIARPGDWRVWAEPETGGEAYIPLARSKWPRSRAVLAQTAQALGGVAFFADGGIVTGGHPVAGAVNNVYVTVEARVEAGIDMGRAGQVIARQVNQGIAAGFDQLARQVIVKAWKN